MEIKDVGLQSRAIIDEVSKAIVGKEDVLNRVMVGILAEAHILFEDYPGLAKTLIARSFAQALGMDFKRIQFTPDLLPSDITGSHVFDRETEEFTLTVGPIFANIVLADEINRATPKTQSALLEAMQESQVTIDGETHPLPSPFIVIATQNPIEYEGTFPLPEAQLDRFMIRLSVGYPDADGEVEILERRRERKRDEITLSPVTSADRLLEMRAAVEEVFVEPDIEKYIVSIVSKTRTDNDVYVGASPRGSLALLKLARAQAALDGRDYVLPDDVKAFAEPALAHRLILNPDLWSKRITEADVVNKILRLVPVPKVG
ncbi:MoxR family ATPase [Candidatus Bipolaricaulota bacterium]|jgi:MoxR-like ATPase|nr:MoxR family ATPase [Candidatus Bipolaricaulota bacterium]